jgi:hypothetical protein
MENRLRIVVTLLISLLYAIGVQAQSSDYSNVTDAEANGLKWAQKDGKWLLLNAAGVELTPAQYDAVSVFSHGLSTVIRNKSIGLVNTEGREVVRAVYSNAPAKFGESAFIPNRGKNEVLSWLYHPQLGFVWINEKGKTVITGSRQIFDVESRIPEKLWDY